MVARFDRQATAAGLTATSAATLGLTPYQVVIVASIAQKEGYFDRYMGKVSRVVYNRLAAGMHLDMTSTVLYALGQDGGTVTQADHTLDTPYNTYLYGGLTPTPICLPSPVALAAAVSPPAGTWLYFTVVDRSGTTRFADTYTEQLANEALAQKNGVG
ncbi:MAG: endolytic transglycosylase MltG [Acidimicrobiales bacterium]